MELCKVCSQEKSAKKKLELKERIAVAKHQLLMEAAGEYRCELQMEPEGASDDFFELKGFMQDCELYCYECTRGIGQQGKVFLVIDEHLHGLSDDCQDMQSANDKSLPKKTETAEVDETAAKDGTIVKVPRPKVRDLTQFRAQKNKER